MGPKKQKIFLFKINGKVVDKAVFDMKLKQIVVPPQPYTEALISRQDAPGKKAESGMFAVAHGTEKKTGKRFEITTTSYENETEQEIKEI